MKSHADVEGSEIADSVAKKADQNEKNGAYVYDRIPISTIASRVKEEWL